MPVEGGETVSELGSLAGLLRRIAATGGRTPAPALGTVIAQRYTLEEYLGRGGMGTVYAARDAELDDLIAIKLLHPELGGDVGYQQRLRAEVRLARRVSHPNVCRVHDIGADKDQLFVTMELVRGRTLRTLLRDRAKAAPPLSTIVDVIVQIASALGAAHRAGVLHRDVKPDNVMLEGSRVVLTDFGVASLSHDHDHVIVGTPAYIAPEVLRGEPFDHRADVYSTAVVAYELMSGKRPFPERTLEAATARASAQPLPPALPATFGTPALRDALDRVFARALGPDPTARFATMGELAEAIAHAVRTTGTAAVSTAHRDATSEPSISSSSSGMRRAEVRLATALVYRSDALDGTSASGEDLERIVVDAGGMPVSTCALEITALFGVPSALGDDAERAARAAQALIARRSGRAGIDTVRVVLSPGSNTLVGPEAFESAAALAAAAKPGAILASTVTARQLAARFEMSGVGVGRADARRLVGARPPVPHASAATFRARELAALVALAEDCFTNRRPRHGQVRAPAGFGKTQLRDALIARLRGRRDIEWLVARGELHGSAGPLALLRAANPEWYAAAERAGLDDRVASFAAARRWLEERAEPRPVGLVLEDLQWADEASRAFVDQLATSLDDVPVLVVTFERANEDERPRPSHAAVQVITLGPLEPATATSLVQALAPGASRDAIADVVARAGGHPLFLQELARELAERGSATYTKTALPATIEAIVQARLDRLDAPTRDLITAAAVIGPTFWRDALVDMAPAAEPGLDERLADLERLALIAPVPPDGGSGAAVGERYRFVHGIVRDAAYARIAPSERRAAHGAVAGWLLRRFPGLDAIERTTAELGLDVLSAFAYHLEEAGEPARAAIAYRAAGARYLAAALYREAAHALRRAATLLPAIDAALATDLGDAIVQADTLTEAESWYERARALLPADDHAGHALLWHKLGTAASRRADTPRALQCYEAGLALAAPDGKTLAPWALRDPRTAALLYGSYGWLAGYQLGDNQRGLPACERAVELLEGTPYRRELAFALSRLGATYMRASRFRDQLECNRRNLEIGVEIGDLMMQLTARVNLGVVYGVIGELADAIEHTEVARELVRKSGARAAAGVVESNLAGLYLECGRLDDAQRCLDDALASHERAGSQNGLPETFGYAARLRAARGDLAGAERWAMKSFTLADELALRLDQAIALRLLAQIRARAGDTAGALEAIGDAAARVAGLDAYEEARTEAARARVLVRTGDERAATAARERALAALTGFGARREVAALDRVDDVR